MRPRPAAAHHFRRITARAARAPARLLAAAAAAAAGAALRVFAWAAAAMNFLKGCESSSW